MTIADSNLNIGIKSILELKTNFNEKEKYLKKDTKKNEFLSFLKIIT